MSTSPDGKRTAPLILALLVAGLLVFGAFGLLLAGGDDEPTRRSDTTASAGETTPGTGAESMPRDQAERLERAMAGDEFTTYRRLWMHKVPTVPPAGTTVQVLDGTYHAGGEYARVNVKITMPNHEPEVWQLGLLDQGAGWVIVTTKAVK